MTTLNIKCIHDAAQRLWEGGVLAFPTETVYGLGADAGNEDAVRHVYALKGRPASHPLIVHVLDMEVAEHWTTAIPAAARVLMSRFWPGPLTVVLPARDEVSRVVTGGQDSVALRAPRHPVAQALLKSFGGGLAAPSANPFGRLSPTEAVHVRAYFPNLTVLDGGACRFGLESTIVSLLESSPRVLRLGALPISALREVLGDMVIGTGETGSSSPRVPGALSTHYAPVTPLIIVPLELLEQCAETLMAQGQRVAVLRRLCHPRVSRSGAMLSTIPSFFLPDNPKAYGRRLYASLRDIDRFGFDCLLVEKLPPGEAWWAVNDRLARASTQDISPNLALKKIHGE